MKTKTEIKIKLDMTRLMLIRDQSKIETLRWMLNEDEEMIREAVTLAAENPDK